MYKKLLLLFPLVLLLWATKNFAQEAQEVTLPLSSVNEKGKLDVDIKMGSITVKGSNRKDVKISYQAYQEDEDHDHDDHCCDDEDGKKRSTEGLKKISGGFPGLEISERSNTVSISAENWSKGINIEIEIPSKFDLKLHTYVHGTIRVDNVTGDIEIENYNGPIFAKNINGTLVGNSYNGDIEVEFASVTPNTPLAFTTYHGNIDISFPATYKGTVKAKTENGDIYTGFDMALKKGNEQFKTEKTSKGTNVYIDSWVSGDINGGGPEIMMKNYYGNIYIRKK